MGPDTTGRRRLAVRATVAVALLAPAGCTHAEQAPAPVPAVAPAVDGSHALDSYPGIERGTELLDERGSGTTVFPLPGAAAWASVVFAVTCDDPEVGPWRLQLHTASGSASGWMAGPSCGGGTGEYPVDPGEPGDPVADIEVQVPAATAYTVLVDGLPAG
jgi:hypothetical protein